MGDTELKDMVDAGCAATCFACHCHCVWGERRRVSFAASRHLLSFNCNLRENSNVNEVLVCTDVYRLPKGTFHMSDFWVHLSSSMHVGVRG